MPYKDKSEQLEYQRLWREKRRLKYIGIMGGCCIKCKSCDNLEIHHSNRETKVSHRIWSWKENRILEEIAKCELLCRDCHFKETAKERGYYQYEHGTLTCYKKAKCRCSLCRSANAENKKRWSYARMKRFAVVTGRGGSTRHLHQ